MPTTASDSHDGGETTEGGAAAASSRVVKIDGDQTKAARAIVNRRKMINEPRIRVVHPLLLGEPTSFAPRTSVSQSEKKWNGNK